MKFFTLIVIGVLSCITCIAAPSDKLIDALVKVESNGDAAAVGDNGKAVGCLQIWKAVVDDVNRFSSIKYTYSDRTNVTKSKEICKKYLLHYGGKNATNEKYARIWNGGPKGHKKSATIGYWKRVKAHLSQEWFFLV